MVCYILHCCGKKLARKDGFFGKSDPYFIIKYNDIPIAFSNIIISKVNPCWQPITLDSDSCGGENEKLTVEVYNFNENGIPDFIGSFTITYNDLVSSLNKKYKLQNIKLKKKNEGQFYISEKRRINETYPPSYSISIIGNSLGDNRTTGDITKPFYVVSRLTSSGKVGSFVCKSNWSAHDGTVTWTVVDYFVSACGGLDEKLIIQVLNHGEDGYHKCIGGCITTLRQLSSSKFLLPVINDFFKGAPGYVNSGMLTLGAVEKSDGFEVDYSSVTLIIGIKSLDHSLDNTQVILKNMETEIYKSETVTGKELKYNSFTIDISLYSKESIITFEVWTEGTLFVYKDLSIREILVKENPRWALLSKNPTVSKTYTMLEIFSASANIQNTSIMNQSFQQTPVVRSTIPSTSNNYRATMPVYTTQQPSLTSQNRYSDSELPVTPVYTQANTNQPSYLSNYSPQQTGNNNTHHNTLPSYASQIPNQTSNNTSQYTTYNPSISNNQQNINQPSYISNYPQQQNGNSNTPSYASYYNS